MNKRSTLLFGLITAAGMGLACLTMSCSSATDPAKPAAADSAKEEEHVPLGKAQLQAALNEPVGKITKTDEEWKKSLTAEQYDILRQAGTEPAFSGDYKSHGPGIYRCAGCNLPLYNAAAKYDSGTGWPSFYQAIAPGHVLEKADNSYGMTRTEVLCARCGGHLGHVFNDGPKPTGLRYCMNSPALKFEKAVPEKKAPVAETKNAKLEKATFAAGCFWSMEAIFKQLKGVTKVEPGYSGGTLKNPSYEQVEYGNTGHAETVDITFDPKVISYEDLLEVLLTVRNPTTLDKQGPDEGPQYRSVIFYHDAAQQKAANEVIARFTANKVWTDPIVTKVEPFSAFYRAEEYHLDYYNKHPDQPYCANVVAPEIKEFQEKFKDKLK